MTEAYQFPSIKRELLDKLRVRMVVFSDRVEINAVFPIAPIVYQKCTSTQRGGRLRRLGQSASINWVGSPQAGIRRPETSYKPSRIASSGVR